MPVTGLRRRPEESEDGACASRGAVLREAWYCMRGAGRHGAIDQAVNKYYSLLTSRSIPRLREVPMPGQRESQATRREQILEAAYEVALRRGIDGLTVRAV